MDSVVNNLLSSWDSVVNLGDADFGNKDKRRHSFFGIKNPSGASISETDNNNNNNKDNGNSNGMGSIASSKSLQLPHGDGSSTSLFGSSSQLTDKLVERIISMALPASSESISAAENISQRLEMQKTRPSFSVPLMSKNFLQLNSRLSVPFEMIDEIIKLISWRSQTYTLAILLIITHMIINPILFLVSPLIYILFGIMVPAYLKHHPPESSIFFPKNNPVPARGLPLYKVVEPKPVPELSREFVLNLTDLQNHVLLYVVTFDFLNWIVLEYCYFKDEAISALVYLILLIATALCMTLIPIISIPGLLKIFQIGSIILLWSAAILFHPYFKDQLFYYIYSEETRLKLLTLTNKVENFVKQEFTFVEDQEVREVEIFEIQYLNSETKNWTLLCYSPDPYVTNSEIRISNLPLEGTQSLQVVKPPVDWEFVPSLSAVNSDNSNNSPQSAKKKNELHWKLDLNPKEWVSRNYLDSVIDIDDDEKWCYDLLTDEISRDGEMKSDKFRRRRWIKQCIRSFQVQEIMKLSEMKQKNLIAKDEHLKEKGKGKDNKNFIKNTLSSSDPEDSEDHLLDGDGDDDASEHSLQESVKSVAEGSISSFGV